MAISKQRKEGIKKSSQILRATQMNATEKQQHLAKPLFTLTVGEFLELQKQIEAPATVTPIATVQPKHVHGIAGIARLFGCSRTTAQKIKQSGKIDKAVFQIGKKITVNADLALELVKRE